MPSAVKADSLEAALAAAVRRFDGNSPVTPQVHAHFGSGRPDRHVRMHLVLEAALAEGGTPDDAVDAACAVEILHHSTLVHADVQGGVPSPFGLAHAINAGDALCAMAYLHVLDGPAHRPPERTVLMTRVLQAANFALCAGLAAEIDFARAGRAPAEEYLAMLEGKAALFAAACELGALAAGAPPERAAAYAALGRAYATARWVEDHVNGDASARGWQLPERTTLETARETLARADAAADAAGIDAGGRVRAGLTRAIRTA
jgi:geranylgeranyl diphosphate synthase type I